MSTGRKERTERGQRHSLAAHNEETARTEVMKEKKERKVNVRWWTHISRDHSALGRADE